MDILGFVGKILFDMNDGDGICYWNITSFVKDNSNRRIVDILEL